MKQFIQYHLGLLVGIIAAQIMDDGFSISLVGVVAVGGVMSVILKEMG